MAVIVAAGPLAACNPLASSDPLPCPFVRVLGDGDRYVRFAPGAEPAPDSLVVDARFLSLDYACEYEDNDQPTAGMTLNLSIAVGGQRGPAAPAGQDLTVPYFVAMIGADQAVVARQDFTMDVPAPAPGETLAPAAPENVSLTFPPGGARAPWEYEVIVSFQLDRDQLQFLREHRR